VKTSGNKCPTTRNTKGTKAIITKNTSSSFEEETGEMTEFKHGKYIITEPKPNIVVPPWAGNLDPAKSTRMMYLDSEYVEGAFYLECVWFWPTDKKDEASPEPHTHDFSEVLAFFGTDWNNPKDLGAEIELWIDGEQNIMNQSFVAFIPAGIVHNPLNILKITRPVFHFATGQGTAYGKA
jgi:hypothetical protein